MKCASICMIFLPFVLPKTFSKRNAASIGRQHALNEGGDTNARRPHQRRRIGDMGKGLLDHGWLLRFKRHCRRLASSGRRGCARAHLAERRGRLRGIRGSPGWTRPDDPQSSRTGGSVRTEDSPTDSQIDPETIDNLRYLTGRRQKKSAPRTISRRPAAHRSKMLARLQRRRDRYFPRPTAAARHFRTGAELA